MRWPWDKTEKRQQSGGAYSDAIVSLIQAQGIRRRFSRRAGRDCARWKRAAGLWARGFASAELDPPIAVISPSVLASIGRSLVRTGQSVWAIDVRRGEITLTPAGSWDVAGGADPASWQYRLDMFGPSGNETRVYPASSVLTFQICGGP